MVNFQSDKPPNAKEINEALKDFGFHHPLPIVQRMYAEYTNNKKYWYGDAGIDQPDEYWRDLSTMNWLSLYVDKVLPNAINIPKEDVIDRLKRGGRLDG